MQEEEQQEEQEEQEEEEQEEEELELQTGGLRGAAALHVATLKPTAKLLFFPANKIIRDECNSQVSNISEKNFQDLFQNLTAFNLRMKWILFVLWYLSKDRYPLKTPGRLPSQKAS